MRRSLFMVACACVALVALGVSTAHSQSRKQRVPDGEALFAFTDDEGAVIQLSQLTCKDGACIEASAILTGCDAAKTPPRRALIVDALSTRGALLSVSAERKGDRAFLSIEEQVPFGSVSFRLVVRINSESNRFVSVEDFSGTRRERSVDAAKKGEQRMYRLHRLSPDEKNLPACGLQLLESAFELTAP